MPKLAVGRRGGDVSGLPTSLTEMSTVTRHTTRAHPAYEPRPTGIRARWLLVTAGLVLTGVVCLVLRPVCQPDKPGVDESAFGVRHEQRGIAWYHCEPWIGRVMSRPANVAPAD
jgi:hypothetical protein